MTEIDTPQFLFYSYIIYHLLYSTRRMPPVISSLSSMTPSAKGLRKTLTLYRNLKLQRLHPNSCVCIQNCAYKNTYLYMKTFELSGFLFTRV